MSVLLHICCGPCTTYPLEVLKEQGIKASGYFYNPNIHPYKEFRKRLEAVEQLASRIDLAVEYDREYGLCFPRKKIYTLWLKLPMEKMLFCLHEPSLLILCSWISPYLF